MTPQGPSTSRLVLAMIGLVAFVLMHGATFPGGHLVHGMAAMSAPDTGASSAAAPPVSRSTDPADHGDPAQTIPGASHGDAGQACLAAVVAIVAFGVLQVSRSRTVVTVVRRLASVIAAPEPPVPRIVFVS